MSGKFNMVNAKADAEFWRLASGACNGTLSSDDQLRLDDLLASDEKVRHRFGFYMLMHAELLWHGRAEEPYEPLLDDGHETAIEVAGAMSSALPSVILDLSPTLEPSLLALRSPIGSFVFSHIAAAVILGIGLLIGLAWRISLPVEGNSHHQSPNIAPNHRRQDSPPTVARITALADCKWTKQGPGVRDPGSGISNRQIPVNLGDRFILSAGLMQITYDTGAKVLLQGPCTYDIDSDRGGYLAVGKLTARVEKKAESTNHSPLSPLPSPLFAVRTPTALVTDLGTEFGVEVEESGATRSHVFQGSVELRVSNSRRSTTSGKSVEILNAGQSACVERGRKSKVAIILESGQPDRFIRRIPSSFILHPSSLSKSPASLYHLTDLGTLGGHVSQARAINAVGQVVGASIDHDGVMRAFLYTDGRMVNLGGGYQGSSHACSINSQGCVVGTWGNSRTNSKTFVQCDGHAFMFRNGVSEQLGTLGGEMTGAYGINDAGEIVGASTTSDGITRAFLFSNGSMRELGALGDSKTNSCAMAVNAAGSVVGYSQDTAGDTHAFLYSVNAGMKDLGALRGRLSVARCINDAGNIVGYANVGNRQQCAFLFNEATGIKDLGASNGLNGQAYAVNNAGQIVGVANVFINGTVHKHAFFYSNGKLVNLNTLFDGRAGWVLQAATGINDSGQITGYGISPDGMTRAFILTPVNEAGAKD